MRNDFNFERSFVAVDARGTEHVLSVFVRHNIATTGAGSAKTSEVREIRDESGEPVQRLGKGIYRISVDIDELEAKCEDDDAP